MKYLLDTSIWFILAQEPRRLSNECIHLVRSQPVVGLSCVSLREISWKHAQGKLVLEKPLSQWLQAALTNQLRLLTITPEIAVDSANLPQFAINDPYDQIIIATARFYNLQVITADSGWKDYEGARVVYFKPSRSD